MTRTWITSLLLLLSHSCNAENSTLPVFREKSTVKPPTECTRAIAPAYHIEELDSTYNLVVDLPNVSPKNLNVNVDFDLGVIEVLGWLESADASSNQDVVKTCIFQEWEVETRTKQTDYVNLYELVMKLEDSVLKLSVPKPEIEDKEEAIKAKISQAENPLFAPAAEGKKLRGFARTSMPLKNVTKASSNTKPVPDESPSPQKLKLAQDLNLFLKVSLANTEEEAYWLHKM
jgi:HSP20 family molecular chaperone IbpA